MSPHLLEAGVPPFSETEVSEAIDSLCRDSSEFYIDTSAFEAFDADDVYEDMPTIRVATNLDWVLG